MHSLSVGDPREPSIAFVGKDQEKGEKKVRVTGMVCSTVKKVLSRQEFVSSLIRVNRTQASRLVFNKCPFERNNPTRLLEVDNLPD